MADYKHIYAPFMNPHMSSLGITDENVEDWARFGKKILIALCGYQLIPKAKVTGLDECEHCTTILELLKKSGSNDEYRRLSGRTGLGRS